MNADRTSPAAGRTGGSRRLVASDHAKGSSVYAPDGNRLGRIERVMVDKETGGIDHAVVNFATGIEADEHPVPWPLLTYNPRFGGYELGISEMPARRHT